MIEWKPDQEFSLHLPAEQAIVGDFKLVVFRVAADQLGPEEIIWEVFGPPRWQLFLETGRADSFDAAKIAAEQALTARQKRGRGR